MAKSTKKLTVRIRAKAKAKQSDKALVIAANAVLGGKMGLDPKKSLNQSNSVTRPLTGKPLKEGNSPLPMVYVERLHRWMAQDEFFKEREYQVPKPEGDIRV